MDSIKNYCTNEDKLTLEQKKAMNSAINAYHDGVLSYGDMLENLALNGGTISELAKGPAETGIFKSPNSYDEYVV